MDSSTAREKKLHSVSFSNVSCLIWDMIILTCLSALSLLRHTLFAALIGTLLYFSGILSARLVSPKTVHLFRTSLLHHFFTNPCLKMSCHAKSLWGNDIDTSVDSLLILLLGGKHFSWQFQLVCFIYSCVRLLGILLVKHTMMCIMISLTIYVSELR